MTERMDRLPKWAIEKIEILEMRLAEAKKELTQLRTGTFGGNGAVTLAQYNNHIDGGSDTVLPEKYGISFNFENGSIECRHAKNKIYVMSNRLSLTVQPRASNTIELMVQDD